MINYCMIAPGNHFDDRFAARSTTPAGQSQPLSVKNYAKTADYRKT